MKLFVLLVLMKFVSLSPVMAVRRAKQRAKQQAAARRRL